MVWRKVRAADTRNCHQALRRLVSFGHLPNLTVHRIEFPRDMTVTMSSASMNGQSTCPFSLSSVTRR